MSLTACQRSETEAPTPVGQVAAQAGQSDATLAAAPMLDEAMLKRVCAAGLAAVHGQTIDAISVDGASDGASDGVVRASWRAPVDGGRMSAECKVSGDRVLWKPQDRPNAEQNRWMDQSGDPVIRYALNGRGIAITQTLPDGTTAAQTFGAAAEQEAR